MDESRMSQPPELQGNAQADRGWIKLAEEDLWVTLQSFIESGEEDEKVEFKQMLSLDAKPERAEFAKDVCAIANTPGDEGYIVIGVVDARKRTGESVVGFSCPDKDAFHRQIVEALTNYANPSPKVSFHMLTHPPTGKPIGVIVVAKSFARPHVIKKSSGEINENEIYIRRGSACTRANREELDEMYRTQKSITVINLSSHTLNYLQKEEIGRDLNCIIQRVIEQSVHFDHDRPFAIQAREVMDEIGRKCDFASLPVVLCLPGFAEAAATVLAEFHGRTGHFPTIIRRRPITSEGARHYEFAETIDLAELRDKSRQRRS